MTSRLLCLLRHAEAASTVGADAERPLTDRGGRDAADVGRWLASAGISPDAVVVSPALRTRQTWAAAAAALPGAPEPEPDRRLYRNTLDDYLQVLRETDDEVAVLVLVGHNPSVAGLAATLLGADAAGLVGEYPPGGLAVVDLAGGWAGAGEGSGTLRSFVAPAR